LNKALNNREKNEMIRRSKNQKINLAPRFKPVPMVKAIYMTEMPKQGEQSAEETEATVEKFMNKLVSKPNLLEDEKLNFKIEKLFDNPTFQKMVETASVFEEADNTTNSGFNRGGSAIHVSN
jgi:hypothetical protein